MPTEKEKKGFDASSITGIPKNPKAGKKLEPGTGPLKPGTTKADNKKQMDKNTANKKATPKPAVKIDTPPAKDKPVKPASTGGTYASAKKKDPKLDSYIKARNNAKKGSSDYNAAQNKINAAYGKGTTKRKVTVADGSKTSTGVMAPKAETKTKAEKVTETGIPKDVKAPKPKTAMDKAKEAIASGDKKAARKSGLKGKTKRVAKRLAKGVDKAKKEATKEKQLADLKSAASPATFKPFDQMGTKNAMATAGEGPMEMNEAPMKLDKTPMEMNEAPMKLDKSPIGYFKQSIKYDIREAANPNLTSSAKKHYADNAASAIKMSGSMKGDQSKTKMDYANFKGTDPKYMGKTGASHGDQSATRRDYVGKKGGSILSKHMKS
jgi:hypothetical protein